MKILDLKDEWPMEDVKNQTTGAYEDRPVHPKYLLIRASQEIMRNTMMRGDKIICHPKHRVRFACIEDFHACYKTSFDGSPDQFFGMELIWSVHHGLEVVSNGEL